MDKKPQVGIALGSMSDLPAMEEAKAILDKFGVAWEMIVASAHRHPEKTHAYGRWAKERGLKVLIAGAGLAAHLAGTLAAATTLPVIGVPLAGPNLGGLDALLATVQMPTGVPVATVAVGGAKNAALLAVQILALEDARLSGLLDDYKEEMKRDIEAKNELLRKSHE
ncbi:MAG: 5-(carboxyamino)imidazole ribonucleotide mutase [Deltaproteobacteria bacterium]|jgi:phosphoribosylaminoimidazole carboxylase PurE protein|nr:5-(carboxyamino)imidazole ribonucleotide mutase [Deltaproteobacteria bacterium]